MKYLQFMILLIIGFSGLYLGWLLAPGQILYPSAPTRNESMLIHYINMHSVFIAAFCATLAIVISSYGLKQSPVVSLFTIPLIGALYATFHTLRMSLPIHIDIALIAAYACGALTALGLVNIIETIKVGKDKKSC